MPLQGLTTPLKEEPLSLPGANLVAINYTGTDARTEIAYDGLGRMKAIGVIDADIEFSAVIEPLGTSYTPFMSGPLSLLGGDYILSFEGLNPNGGDNTAFVDAVTLNATLVGNGSFEVPDLGNGNYEYRPAGGTWSFVDNSGISGNGSTFTAGNPPAPDGDQVGFLQETCSISQPLSLSAGTYTLQFKAAQRGDIQDTFQTFRADLKPAIPMHVISGKTFVWSGNTIAEERDSTGASVTKRFFAEGEQRVAGVAGNYYYTRDHLGSIREVTGANGVLQGQYDYDAWGNSVVTKGKMQVDFGYTGHYFHQPSGLNLAMYRAYSPTLGRWLSRDPVGEKSPDGPNLYNYVRNDPANFVDPTGLWGIGWGDGNGNVSWNIGVGDPTFLFTPDSGMDISMAAAATLDGIIPFADPFAGMGAYDPCDPAFRFSQGAGAFSRDVYTGRLLLGGLARLGGTRFALNHNPYVRFGPGRWGGEMVPRISIGRQGPPWWEWMRHWRL
jgi:RHS repeat-associated protein